MGPPRSLPIFFSNPDFTYVDTFVHPRITSGAFRICLEALYREATVGHDAQMSAVRIGKPEAPTYAFAERVLASQLPDALAGARFNAIYAIGDNPLSDVCGANAAGPPWRSILVRTGVFAPHDGAANDATHPAAHVVDDVAAAIALVFELEASALSRA
eukprot:Amastigsp_a176570_19.p1 type:complete len:158 gc:universal Amastigsp_a176570_19:487-14(-)